MSDPADKIITFLNVGYAIDGADLVTGLDFTVEAGETLVLLGESGCGKTTTLRLINRLIEPTTGKVIIEGTPTSAWNEIELRRRIGYVLQDGGLFPHMTVGENVGLVLKLQGADPSPTRDRISEMLDLVGLETAHYADRYPHELSGGQRQRVGVARALASDPDILLLDEPFAALDAITRTGLQMEFARLVRKLAKTAVFVTHDLREAMLLGTRIALMDKGRIVLHTDAEGFRRSEMPLVRSYLDTIAATA
ncbi:MAG: ATP-binding cassette domain-containing protein [Pyrinomonadaceae bacterium]